LRFRSIARLLALAAVCASSALWSADAAPAALSWTGADVSLGANCVPCYPVAVEIVGDGHVSGVPLDSPDAGRLECPASPPWDCSYFFTFIDGTPDVILTPTPGPGQTFQGWEPAPDDPTSVGCPLLGPGPIQCHLTNENAGGGLCLQATFTGSGSAGSCAFDPPPPPLKPVNTSPPSITGTPTPSHTLTGTNGTWAIVANPITGFAYRWLRCAPNGASCVAITGATANTYAVTGADVGASLRIVVTATNSVGSTDATSPQRLIVSAIPPKCVVPRVVGKTLAAAKIAIKAKHCRVGLITRVRSTRIARGRVVSTTPRAGVRKPNGTKVKIYVSRGRV